MDVYHQCGHNDVWNRQSIEEDKVGDGLIISPVNIDASRITDKISTNIINSSLFDPQMYLPGDDKGSLSTYHYFPINVVDQFSTSSFRDNARKIAKSCIDFQINLDTKYLVIPTRYFTDLPDNYLSQLDTLYVEPFIKEWKNLEISTPLLLTLIVKPIHLEFGKNRDEILTWATSYPEISGLYLIFENHSTSKQIKDPAFLSGALRFINVLRKNQMEVHVGYSGLEGILYSIADPTSVTMGSYENLRSFDISRLQTMENEGRRGPRPRIYSSELLQWIVDISIPPIKELLPNWESYFSKTKYSDFLLNDQSSLNFQRSEIYKHYFILFYNQVKALPTLEERPDFVRKIVNKAMVLFSNIEKAGIALDSDSNGSHLPSWLNAIAMYERNSG